MNNGPPIDSPLALFVSERFIVGGVETLMSRLSQHLTSHGWRVAVLTSEALPASRDLVPKGAGLHELNQDFRLLFTHRDAVRLVRSLGLDEVRLIFTGDPVGSWIATLLSSALPEHPKVLCGVYQQQEYCYPSQREFFRSSYSTQMRARNFDRNLADSSKIFYSSRVRDIHAANFGRPLDSSPILMVPVDRSMFTRCQRTPDRFKIVSVGRVTAWKTYNLYMIPVIRRLVDKGYPVQWDVYGVGDAWPRMRQLISELDLDAYISLKGTLDYRRMSEVMEDAGVFVGMGTAMLEAAFCRVPCVVAVARELDPLTYGYIYDLPLGSVGEQLEHSPRLRIESMIERLFTLSDAEYRAEMERTLSYVQPYELQAVCRSFMRLIESAAPAHISRFKALAYRLHSRYLGWRSRRAWRKQDPFPSGNSATIGTSQ